MADPAAGAKIRKVLTVREAPSGFEGEGFPVRRAFAGVAISHLDPFIHMDQMGEVEYAPGEAKGTSWHPHRGFETVTYLLDGEFVHLGTPSSTRSPTRCPGTATSARTGARSAPAHSPCSAPAMR